MCAPPEKSITGCPKKSITGCPKKVLQGVSKKYYRVSQKKVTNRMEQRCTAGTPHVWKLFLVVFFTVTKRVKHSQVTLIGKFGPAVLYFCQHFFLLVTLLGYSVYME